MKLKEQIVGQTISTNVLLFIFTGVGTLAWTAVRMFFRIGTLEKQVDALIDKNERQDLAASKRNEKQDQDIKDIHVKANDTNDKVSTILGYLDGSTGKGV